MHTAWETTCSVMKNQFSISACSFRVFLYFTRFYSGKRLIMLNLNRIKSLYYTIYFLDKRDPAFRRLILSKADRLLLIEWVGRERCCKIQPIIILGYIHTLTQHRQHQSLLQWASVFSTVWRAVSVSPRFTIKSWNVIIRVSGSCKTWKHRVKENGKF